MPLTTNDAGLRYPSTIGRKQPGVRRLVLLGDSFVAATAAHYEDGVAPQLQGILRRCSASSGPRWEVLPIAVGGWNLVSSASYLLHNMHEIEPDAVVHVLCTNDFDNGYGFILGGVRSATYDGQARLGPTHMSTASPSIALRAATPIRGLVGSCLIPESERRFREAASIVSDLMQRLEEYGGASYSIYVLGRAALGWGIARCFGDVVGRDRIAFDSGQVARNNLLPADGHPNREGHRFLAMAIARYLHDRGIVALDLAEFAREGEYAPYSTANDGDLSEDAVRRFYGVDAIPSELRIEAGEIVGDDAPRTILGGLFAAGVLGVQSGFVLRRREDSRFLRIELEVPEVPALYGGALQVQVNGAAAGALSLDARQNGGAAVLSLRLPDDGRDLVEVILTADSYYTSMSHALRGGVYGPMPRCGVLRSIALRRSAD